MPDPAVLGRPDSWAGVRAVVAGFGGAGFAAADNLLHLGASVVALDEDGAGRAEQAELLGVLGAEVRLEAGALQTLPDDVDLLVVTTPGPLVAQAHDRGVATWGEAELAWRLRDPSAPAPWLVVAGEAGATVELLEAMLRHAGLRTVACGATGLPLVEAVMDPEPYDVLAIGLAAHQLEHVHSVRAESAAVLHAAPGLGRAYHDVERACVYSVSDPGTERLVREAEVQEGARAIGITLGIPAVGMLGVVEDVLADRAFIEERHTSAAELATLADLADPPPERVREALAAAALARGHGVPAAAVRDALRATRP